MNDTLSETEKWQQTPDSFKKFLTWLDQGNDTEGRSYLEIRRRLVGYFDRKGCSSPDDLADETLVRVSRRLEEEGQIESDTPAHYCYITARYIFLESLRKSTPNVLSLDESVRETAAASVEPPAEETAAKEVMLVCLESCTSKLDNSSRELIFGYYFGKAREKIENRRFMAAKLGVSANALAIKACRIRNKLEACVGKCSKNA
jgi:DNA-directed RNA polymerase specialized sigma24 family protein